MAARSLDFHQVVLEPDHFLTSKVPATLRKSLVFNMDSGDAALFILADGPHDIELVPIPRVGIRDQGQGHASGNPARIARHFGHREYP